MSAFPHIAERAFNTPLMLHPAKAEIIVAALADRLGIRRIVRADGSDAPLVVPMPMLEQPPAPESGYDLFDGIAVIPVRGTLVQRTGSLRPMSGMTGYDGVRQAFVDALADDAAEAVMFDIDSPGGEVAGCFDLADAIYAARGVKPIYAVLGEVAFSAAYAIASAAEIITVPRTGGTGSIGVIYLHVDMSGALDQAGLTVTVLKYGANKADGADCLPLSKSARNRMQADIDTIGDLFVETVARNRGIPAARVRDTQAGTYLGAAGLGIGLADLVMAPDQAFGTIRSAL